MPIMSAVQNAGSIVGYSPPNSLSRTSALSVGESSANLTLPDCLRVALLSGVEFRPQSRLGRVRKDGSLESDDLMFWDVPAGLCRDVVPLAHEPF